MQPNKLDLETVNICHGGAAELIIGIPFRDNILAGVIMAGPFRLPENPRSAYQEKDINSCPF